MRVRGRLHDRSLDGGVRDVDALRLGPPHAVDLAYHPDDRCDDHAPAGDLGGTDANKFLCHRVTLAEAQMAGNGTGTFVEAKGASEARRAQLTMRSRAISPSI